MKRKLGSLLPLEVSILDVGLKLLQSGNREFHGFQIAKEIKEEENARHLTAYGTLYKALGRMEDGGLLTSHWEDPEIAARENRPRRRLYQVTAAGATAFRTVGFAVGQPAQTFSIWPARS